MSTPPIFDLFLFSHRDTPLGYSSPHSAAWIGCVRNKKRVKGRKGNFMNKMKLKVKLIVSFIIVAIIASSSGIFGILVCSDMNDKYSEALTNQGSAQGIIGLYGVSLAEADSALRSYAGYLLADAMTEQKNLYTTQKQNANTYLPQIEPTMTTDDGMALYTKLKNAHDAYFTEAEALMNRMSLNMTDEQRISAQTDLANELTPLYETAYNACVDLMNYKSGVADSLNASLTRSVNFSVIIAVVMTTVAVLLSLIFSIALARSIVKPVNAIIDRLHEMKKGDFSSPSPTVKTRDEIYDITEVCDEIIKHLETVFQDVIHVFETMAKGDFTVKSNHRELYVGDLVPIFQAMVDLKSNVTNVMTQIHESADQVASGSEQVASGSQALSQGATEQASSVQELAATINEISNRVTDNASHAREATEQAVALGKNMQASNTQMTQLISAMHDISNSSSEIGKIIKTIEDIAFQTNILALNAAVEAARAGSAGKGFAVVADEVRNLASKSAEASANTATLIETSIKAVENGSAIADATAASLLESVKGAEAVVGLIENINNASAEQADQINQVSIGIDQISSVVQTNSATAEESAAESEELSGQSTLLKTLVAKFKLDSTLAAAAPAANVNTYADTSSYDTTAYSEPIQSASDSYSSADYGYNDKY